MAYEKASNDDANETLIPMATNEEKIDFIILLSDDNNEIFESDSDSDATYIFEEVNPTPTTKRRIFERNLKAAGLKLTTEPGGGDGKKSKIKITIPENVLLKYCEILKLRVPINKTEIEKLLKKKAEKFINNEKIDTETDSSNNYQNLTKRTLFRKKDYKWTAEYTRNEQLQSLFDTKSYFTPSMKAMIINFILERESFSNSDTCAIGINQLLLEKVYEAAYPPHEGNIKDQDSERGKLIAEWASFKAILKPQPIDEIADYLGYKIAMYFAWIGFYTHMLLYPSIFGVIVTFIGVFLHFDDKIVSEVCYQNSSLIMCPRCDGCDYWTLSEACTYTKYSRVFDNVSTIFFPVIMSIWSAIYQKCWSRYSAELIHRWGLTGFDVLTETPRPQYLIECQKKEVQKEFHPITFVLEPHIPYWEQKVPRLCFSYALTLFWIALTFSSVIALVIYGIIMEFFVGESMNILINISAAALNLIVINLLNYLYSKLAKRLTDREYHRTQSEYDNSLIIKIFMFQYVNYYSSLFYIGFFKGKFTGYPKEYRRIFGFRQEECSPGGCLIELTIQLAVIMVGDQIKDNILEILWPIFLRMQRVWGEKTAEPLLTRVRNVIEVTYRYDLWDEDEELLEYDDEELIYEYLEMVMQYGFVTIFVTAFPLAPLFALANNILEIRLDSKKLMDYYRKPVSQRVENIGVWYNIINVISKVSIVSNAFIVVLTSNIIPLYITLPDGIGFLTYTLSIFNVSDFDDDHRPTSSSLGNVTYCAYEGFRHPPESPNKYKHTEEYWRNWSYQFSYVIVYILFVSLCIIAIKMFVPNTPKQLKLRIKSEAYYIREMIIRKGYTESNNIRSS